VSDGSNLAYYCYIVECADGTFYTGWTTNPERRVKEHNAGRGALYTRFRRPVKLIYLEEAPDRSAAQRREFSIKKLTRDKKNDLVKNYTRYDSKVG
jgi:putative endonuclease